MDRVLIIKHGALGDFVLSIGHMLDIQRKHPGAHFTLLTGSPYVSIGRQMGFFSDFIIDNRTILETPRVLRQIIAGNFTHVYDLQSRTRTHNYRRLTRFFLPAGTCQWHVVNDVPKKNPEGNIPVCYTISKKHRLGMGSVSKSPWTDCCAPFDISFLHGKAEHFDLLPERYVLFIPGCSAANAYKRWPIPHFIEIARRLAERNINTVVIGTQAEEAEISAICNSDPTHIINMMGKTQLLDIPQIALRALCTIGNDTGPTHMASLSGAPAIGLYDKRTGHAQLTGKQSTSIVSESTIDLITPDRVWETLLPHLS